MSDQLKAAAERLLRDQHDACDHIWNAHQQCQWCHRDRRDVDADEVASGYLSQLDRIAELEQRLAAAEQVVKDIETLSIASADVQIIAPCNGAPSWQVIWGVPHGSQSRGADYRDANTLPAALRAAVLSVKGEP